MNHKVIILYVHEDMDNCMGCSSLFLQLSIRELRTKCAISYAVLYNTNMNCGIMAYSFIILQS